MKLQIDYQKGFQIDFLFIDPCLRRDDR